MSRAEAKQNLRQHLDTAGYGTPIAGDASLYDQLRADRNLIPIAVEESLRHDSSTKMLMRDCIRDLRISDRPNTVGDKRTGQVHA